MDDQVFQIGPPAPASSLAIFDFDHTLVKPQHNRRFPKNADDWRWWRPSVPAVVRAAAQSGMRVVVVTDQSKPWKLDMIRTALAQLDVPVLAVVACKKESKKPNPALFLSAVGAAFDPGRSFFVGDAAGREGDFADTDKRFAAAVGVDFKVPEDAFPV